MSYHSGQTRSAYPSSSGLSKGGRPSSSAVGHGGGTSNGGHSSNTMGSGRSEFRTLPSSGTPPLPSSSQRPLSSAGGASGSHANAPPLSVSGGRNPTVANIIKGEFEPTGSNHNRPVYSKQGAGVTVLIYFWDDRDGPSFSGWWFGPKVGGDQVWAYNAAPSGTPPPSGWKVPWDGPVDDSLRVVAAGGGSERSSRGAPLPTSSVRGGDATLGRGRSGGRRHEEEEDRRRRGGGGERDMVGADPRRRGMDPRDRDRREAERREAERRELEQRREAERREAERREAERREAERREAERREAERREAERRAEADRRRREEEKRRWEEAQQRRREEEARRAAEAKRRREEEEKRQREADAAAMVRKVICRLRNATPEDFEQLKEDMERAQEQNYEAMGPHARNVAQEAEKALQQAVIRVAEIEEKRAAEEKARIEAERQKKEDEDRVGRLQQESTALVVEAEERAADAVEETKAVATLLEASEGAKEATPEAVIKAAIHAKAAVEAAQAVRESASKAIDDKQAEMGHCAAERNARSEMRTLHDRLSTVRRSLGKLAESLEATREKAVRKEAALKRKDAQQAAFESANESGGGRLSAKDVANFAKATYDFELPDKILDEVLKTLEPITIDKFARMRRMVGIARLEALTRVRRAEELERKRVEEEQLAALQKLIDEAGEHLSKAEASAATAEGGSRTLAKVGVDLTPEKINTAIEEIEAAVGSAADGITATKSKVVEVERESAANEALKSLANAAIPSLQQRCSRVESQLAKASGVAKDGRELAAQKAYAVIDKLRTDTIAAIRANMDKENLTSEQMFADKVSSDDGAVGLDKFAAFIRELPDLEMDEADSKKVAKQIIGEAESLSKDCFCDLVRLYYKCVKQTTMSEEISIKSKAVRRIELQEALEVLEGPMKDDGAVLMRLKCKAMNDGVIGWVTIAGNQGTKFLDVGGNLYNCVKETAITDNFSVQEGQTIRKLAKGEKIEVLEFPRKDESVGVRRIKGKSKLDGCIGWIALESNQGTIYLELV